MLELTTFRLVDGGDPDAFVAADAAAQVGFHHLQPGMMRRTTAKGEADDWLVLILWRDAEAAAAAEVAGESSMPLQEFWAHVDRSSVEVRRFFPLAG
ncbi:MAG TPA: hypothetical protein VM143_00010 [Acidimicrobiales bacterium]|nr:hypothetical protein [Acidimicrobiales bacterium]